jgi:hypothetical protein
MACSSRDPYVTYASYPWEVEYHVCNNRRLRDPRRT